MKRKLFAVSLAAMLLLAGCGGGKAAGGTAADMPASSAPSGDFAQEEWNGADENYWEMPSGGESMPAPMEPASDGSTGGSVYQNPRAKLIRRAELTIQTEQFDESVAALKKLTAECEGYFENASLYGGGRRDAYANRSGEYVVRVPAEQYDQFLTSAGDLGYVTSKSESSKDVGEEYFDIEARLKTQRTKQERLLALLEKAETMEDIIALESALSDVEYQIEMYSSDLRRYDALIGYSTFNVYLNEVNRVNQEVGETSSLGQRMAAGFQSSVRGLGQGFQDFLVWVSYHVFLVVILAAVTVVAVFVGKRELKKIRKQDEKKSEEK